MVCSSVGGLVGRLTRGHQETGGLDVYCILCDGFVDVFVRFHGLEYAHCTSIKLF